MVEDNRVALLLIVVSSAVSSSSRGSPSISSTPSLLQSAWIHARDIYILAIIPSRGGGFLSKLKAREEFEGGLEKRKGKEEKKEKSDKIHYEIPL